MYRTRPLRQGSIFVVMLLLLPIIILFAGFAVDVAYVQRIKMELRSATDLAAKSAALDLSQYSDMTSARQKAIEIAADNEVGGLPLALAAEDIVFGNAARQADGRYLFSDTVTPFNAVKIVGRRTSGSSNGAIRSFFGSFYGHPEYQPTIESFAAFVDVDICLVLDRSGSMKLPVMSGDPHDPDYKTLPPAANSRWLALDNAVRSFLDVMSNSFAKEKVALVTFASDVTIDQDLQFDMSLIESELDDRLITVWDGQTDIEAGIVEAQAVLDGTERRTTAQRVMVVLTDGNYTAVDPQPAASQAAAQGIRIHTITFGDSADQDTMQQIALAANGRHYHADSASDLSNVFHQIAASLTVLID